MTRLLARACIPLALACAWTANAAAVSGIPAADAAKAAKGAHAANVARPAHAVRASRPCERASCGRPALPAWRIARFRYSTSGTPLADVLRDLSQETQVPVSCGTQLTGRVEGRFDMPPQRFLEVLAHSFELVWYYDGAVLHVDAARSQPTLVFRLNYASSGDLHALLAQTGKDDPRFPLRVDTPARGLVTVRGPAPYLSLVGRAAQQLETAARMRVKTSVRIVRLHYGAAADRTALTNDRTNVVRGIASRAASVLDPHGDMRADMTEYEPALPVISADPRTNAVLIRDRPQKLDDDARAVAALDRPEQLVAIRLLIADVRPETLSALGLAGAGHLHLQGASAQAAADSIRHASGARVVADSELLTVGGVAVAYERKAPRPVFVAGAVAGDAGASEVQAASAAGTVDAGSTASTARQDADVAVRVVPSIGAAPAHRSVALAVEWRGTEIDVARIALDPEDALVMIEKAPAMRTDATQDRAWVVMLVPRLMPG